MNIYKKVWQQIKKSKNVLITLHANPDGDSIGSSLSLYHALTKIGKKVTVVSSDSPVPSVFSNLPGARQILNKNFFDLDLSKFDLYIINDIAAPGQISRTKEVVLPSNLKTIMIDHHISNTGFADINLIDSSSPATCQLVFDLFKINRVKITSQIAECLFLGLYTDTGGFKYLGSTYKTLSTAAYLAKIYPDFHQLIFNVENNDHPDRLKFLSLILDSVETHFLDNLAIASLDYQTIKSHQLNPSVISSSEIANILKSITGWQVGVAIIEPQPNNIKVSFRTRDASKFDLSKVAVTLGGGGHKAAAGLVFKDISIDEAKKQIIKAVKKTYPDIDKTDIKT